MRRTFVVCDVYLKYHYESLFLNYSNSQFKNGLSNKIHNKNIEQLSVSEEK